MTVRDSAAAIGVAGLLLMVSADLSAQDVPAASATTAAAQPDSLTMPMPAASDWMLMQDGILFVSANRQGGSRGGTEVDAPNWRMGTASRSTSRGRLTFNAMISLD